MAKQLSDERAKRAQEALEQAVRVAAQGLTAIMIADPRSSQGRMAAKLLGDIDAELDKGLATDALKGD
jgi:hypothetical protein